MARNQGWWPISLGIWLAAGITSGWAEEPADKRLLQDGEHSVTIEEYQRTLLALPETQRAPYQGDVQRAAELLRYIDRAKRMAAEAERLGLDNQPEVRARLAAARLDILSGALLERYEHNLQDPDFEELAREYYLANRDQYRVPEKRALAQIELKVACECERANKRALAETVLAKLRAGESFEKLAVDYSDDRSNAVNRGGRLPLPMTRGDNANPIVTAAFALDPEHPLSDIVETPQGFYLLRLLEQYEATERDFESVKADIIKQIRSRYRAGQRADYVAQFSTSPAAVINEALLKQQSLPK